MTVQIALLLLITNTVSLLLSTVLYVHRCDDLRRKQQTLIQQINDEHRMQARIMAQVRVEDLLGRTEEL